MHETIQKEMQLALKNRDTLRLSVLRGMLTAFTNQLVASKRTPQEKLTDEEVLSVITRLAKQRKESIAQFTAGGRLDLVENEEKELIILEEYLPELMGREDIVQYVQTKQTELSIHDKSQAGLLIGAIMKDLKGKADGAIVKEVVEELL